MEDLAKSALGGKVTKLKVALHVCPKIRKGPKLKRQNSILKCKKK